MKKTIITVFAFMVIFGFAVSGSMAQTWTWSDPITVTVAPTSLLTDIVVDPVAGTVWGVRDGGLVEVNLTQLAVGNDSISQETVPPDAPVIEAVPGPSGVLYVITATDAFLWTPAGGYTLVDPQPLVPEDGGSFSQVARGPDGKMYILYTAGDNQYLLVGAPPVADGLVIKLLPRSLNLSAKGNWVTCMISIPGYDVAGIDPSSIRVTQFEIDGTPYPVSIPVDPSAPMGKAKNKIIVKFLRYDSSSPHNPESFVGALSPIVTRPGKVDVTATIEATHSAGTFFGQDTFRVIVIPAKPGRP